MNFLFNFKQIYAIILSFIIVGNTIAANYPLEIINIKPVGTGTPAITQGNRIFNAYPGITYNISVAVIGGLYPYKYSLTQNPAGMTIDSISGEINWPNPQATANAAIRVKDCEGTEVEASWSINVAAAGFIFIDSAVSTAGDGSFEKPFKRIKDLMGADKFSNTYKNKIVYIRKGSYDLEGYYDNVNDPTRITFYNKPTVWLAYPNEKVIIDYKRQNIYQFENNIYQEGFEIKNCGDYGIQAGGNYNSYRKLYFHGLVDMIGGSNNQSFLRLNAGGYATVIKDCIFDTTTKCDVKLYSHTKCLIENNIIRNNYSSEGFAVKMSCDSITIRNNVIYGLASLRAITIDAYKGDGRGCKDIEILNNKIYDTPIPMVLGSNGALGKVYVYRNIIKGNGTPLVRLVSNSEGPVVFNENEIENVVADKGLISSNNYYRNGVLFDYSPNVYNNNVIIKVDSPTRNNSTSPFFLPKAKVKAANSSIQYYNIAGKKIQISKVSGIKAIVCNSKSVTMLKISNIKKLN